MTRTVVWLLLACSSLLAGPGDRQGPVFSISRCDFDTALLVVRLSWTSDSIVTSGEYEAGIAASCVPGERPKPFASFICSSLSGDTSFTIENAVFDTVYTVFLLAKFQGQWLPADSASMRSIRVASSLRQPVSYFSSGTHDTVKALGGRLMLWKGPDYPAGLLPGNDTAAAYAVPDSQLDGFVAIGKAIRFLNPQPSPSFFLALRYGGDASALRWAGSLGLYKDSAGVMIVQRDAINDSANKRMVIKTYDVSLPYAILADTVPPLIGVKSDTSRPIDTLPVIDTFTVADNSVNLAWAFYRATGAQPCETPVASGLVGARSGRILCTLPVKGAQAAGVRAFLIVSDGVFTDTVPLSRRAVRPHSDATTTPEKSIIPFAATALPDDPGMRSCLANLFSDAGNRYDPSAFRIFRWFPNQSNAQKADKWLEYSSSNEAEFQCRPGALFWLITGTSATIDFGRSTTLSLKAPYSIRLPSREWTDFGVPFGFDMHLSEVIGASGRDAGNLVIYRWVPDSANRTYSPEMVYGSRNVSGESPEDTLFSGPQSGYTVYNPGESPFELVFPPLSVSMKNGPAWPLSKKRTETRGYCIKVSAAGVSSVLSSVYCGIQTGRPDTLLFPAPPSFSQGGLSAGRQDGTCGAILLYPPAHGGVACFPIAFKGCGQAVRIRASKMHAAGNVDFLIAKKSSSGYERLPDGFEPQADGSAQEDFMLIAGERQLIASFLDGAWRASVSPPAISFRVRLGSLVVVSRNLAPGDQCRLSVFDLRGKRISHTDITSAVLAAANGWTVSTKLPAGMYMLASTVIRAGGKFVEKRLIAVP
jgi:hypothetical protein